ncbi:HEPN domain-containing protein [Sphingobium ummariense]|uniref:HEPN domain-containing protein n=1 Tax=Sphingobium ummariense TaxID=420994 RepID=UPI0009FD68B0
MRKAAQALASAHQLLAGGDADGACNRAYYAMFDAAHAALRSANVAETASATKTHRGLIAAFGQHLVLGGHVASELGSSLNRGCPIVAGCSVPARGRSARPQP